MGKTLKIEITKKDKQKTTIKLNPKIEEQILTVNKKYTNRGNLHDQTQISCWVILLVPYHLYYMDPTMRMKYPSQTLNTWVGVFDMCPTFLVGHSLRKHIQ